MLLNTRNAISVDYVKRAIKVEIPKIWQVIICRKYTSKNQ